MDTFDNLWQRYLRNQRGGEPMANDQIKALRRAFFTGAWYHMKFTQRMLQAEEAVAVKLMVAAELELSDEMKALPQEQIATYSHNKLTRPPPAQVTQMTITTMKRILKFTLLTGWLIPGTLALWYFGRWIREIVVPTLKGGNFEQLYDLHGVSYLHVTMWSVVLAFAWGTLVVILVAGNRASSK